VAEREPFLLRCALRLAADGMPVFPLRPHTKVPAIERWPQHACTDPDTIRAWWAQSAFNIGIATGSPSGIVVVDLDAAKTPGQPHGRQSLAALARDRGETIPRHTRTVVTPSGGQHLYFRLPPEVDLRNTAGHLGRHVDTRGSGGYVVGPGSVVNGRRYRLTVDEPPLPIPGWLLQELLQKPPAATPPALPRCSAYVDAVLRGEAERVEQAAVGTRNHTLFRAAARLGSFVAEGLVTEDIVIVVLEHACRHHTNFHHREIARTIASGLRRARSLPASAAHLRTGVATQMYP
jgi:Bifunctional DNA primase/polymerase, N-terminal